MRDHGCAVLGAGGGVGGWVGVVGSDSVKVLRKLGKAKKKQGSVNFDARASWGAAVLRPYTEVIW